MATALLLLLNPSAESREPSVGADAKARVNSSAALDAPAVIVTGNPVGSDLMDLASPADVLHGATLRARLEPTLGETLANEVGVSSSYFGPAASRPVIRGLDGERVRILQNGAGVLDASGASPDHAVALEPLTLDRIEIVRGPAALLYGGSAIGGVVNAIDNRIAQVAPDRPFSGSAELRFGGPADERAGVARLSGGSERLALHVDAFRRDTSDLRIPGFARSARLRGSDPLAPPESEAQKRLPNSASSSDGLGLGATTFFDRGHVGFSIATLGNNYGTVASPDVIIDMKQTRYDLAGEVRELGFVENARFRVGFTDYRHTEFDAGAPSTRFSNKGFDARVDLRHQRIGRFDGAFGLQLLESRFRALGDEAFVPPVKTQMAALFLYEETSFGALKLSGGARVDQVRLSAEEYLPGFSPAESRSYTPKGASLGAVLSLSQELSLAANLSYTQRAPNYAEVFANGPHAATSQFEVGNRNQGLERATAFDLALRKRGGMVTGSLGVFAQRFGNFIALLPTGATDAGSGLDIFQFTGVKAEFRGVEADTRLHLIDTIGHTLHLDLRADYTRAENVTDNTPLPRIAPLRFTVAAVADRDGTGFRLEAIRASDQNRVAANELPTDGYTLVNLRLTHRLHQQDARRIELFLRASNLLNEEVRFHTSVLKDLAPLGGRSVMVGINGAF